MFTFATMARKSFNFKFIAKNHFPIGHFNVNITNADISPFIVSKIIIFNLKSSKLDKMQCVADNQNYMCHICEKSRFLKFKGALDNFSLIPIFFQNSWDFYTTRSIYLCSYCMLILRATATWLQRYSIFSCSSHF